MAVALLKKVFLGLTLLIMAGVTACHKAPPSPPTPATRPSSKPTETRKPVDTRTQQLYYDRGLQAYSKENYEDARGAFQRVVALGSNTALGLKAQENLRKIQKILKTLEEIESK